MEEREDTAMNQSSRYHYRECGLDNIYLVNGFDPVETPRGTGAMIKDREGLHRAIANLIVREKKDMTGGEFRFLRHELNMTQQLVANLLQMDVQSVARWEKGKSDVPGPAQGLMRLLYEEKANGNTEISEPLRRLAELDEILQDEDEIVEFEEDTNEGWRLAQAA